MEGEFLIGKAIDAVAGGGGGDAKNADMIIDELEVWTADRQTLLDYNFIQRGESSSSQMLYTASLEKANGVLIIYPLTEAARVHA